MGDEADLAGQKIGGYRIVRRLGRGGMGAVYEALQESLGRRVALKRLHAHLSDDAGLVARFRREAEAAAQLGHPNIVAVTDFGRDEAGAAFLVMEYLVGRSLADVLREEGALAPERVAFIAWQVLAALAAAHRTGIVHRDLKPDNVMLVELSGVRDVVKLLDFGIAKLAEREGDVALTSTGMVLGTPAYMSPEQARGAAVDARTDLYAVGVLMYEALSGRLPFTGASYNALLAAILTETPPPLGGLRAELDPGLVAVVARAMATAPAGRFSSAEQMQEALVPFTGGRARPSATTPAPAAPLAHSTPPRQATPEAFAATAVSGASAPDTRAAAPPRSLALPVVGLVGVAGALALAFFLGESASRTPPPPPPSTATSVAPPTDVAPPESAALVDAAAEDAGTDAGLLPEDAALELAPHHDPAPRHFAVHYTGCDAHALFDTSAVHAAFDRVSGDVAACVHAPTGPMNFDLTVTGDGEVVSVAPHGTPAPGTPALRACVMRALRGASMGTRSRSGEGGIVTVSFRDGR